MSAPGRSAFLFTMEVIMTISTLKQMIQCFAGFKNTPQIEVFTNIGQPADLISVEYCKENNVIMLQYETREK